MNYKIKDCFEMKKIADDFLVIPIGSIAVDFNAVLVFNESGAFLWDFLKEGAEEDFLIQKLMEKYDITKKIAQNDVHSFIVKLQKNDILMNR